MDNVISKLELSIQTTQGRTLSESDLAYLPRAAVGVILSKDQSAKELVALLVKRITSETDPWSGHMAFPGGRMKNGESLFQTARREVYEETKIETEKCRFFGNLNDRSTGNRTVVVRPFVFFSPNLIPVTIDLREIEDYVWVPVSFFADKENIRSMRVNMRGKEREVITFPYSTNYIVWGMTLRIIQDLLERT